MAFCREHPAEEVYVTGTFDDWTKSVKLDKEDGVFQKTVDLKDASKKIYYKVCEFSGTSMFGWAATGLAPRPPLRPRCPKSNPILSPSTAHAHAVQPTALYLDLRLYLVAQLVHLDPSFAVVTPLMLLFRPWSFAPTHGHRWHCAMS
jgi:hypothetical protein